MKIPGVIVDLDGTLVDVSRARRHLFERPKQFELFELESVSGDAHVMVVELVNEIQKSGFHLLIVSGRSSKWLLPTMDWLQDQGIVYTELLLREHMDFRSDAIVKREMLHHLRAKYEVALAIDDNPKVIEVWRDEGIPTVRVPGWAAQEA